MKFVFVFFALIVVVAGDGASDAKWEEFKKSYGKDYQQKSFNGQNEETLRKNTFLKRDAEIQRANSDRNNLFRQGHNAFSDMFDSELAALKGAKKPADDKGTILKISRSSEDRQALPAFLDYRTHKCMAAIRNQAACGSCWAFAAINPLEFSACNKTATKVLTPLSEQHLVDCDVYDNSCQGGWPTNAWYYIKAKNGSAKAASYAYSSATCCTATTCCARKACKYTAAMLGSKVNLYGNVGSTTSNNTAMIMQSALLQFGPLAVAITTAPSFMSYKSGIYNDVACDNKTVDHAINIVGYGKTNATECSPTGTDYWIIRNSWGTTWGLLGYGMIQRGVNKCSIESYPMAVVAA